jgi:hypothetical protein
MTESKKKIGKNTTVRLDADVYKELVKIRFDQSQKDQQSVGLGELASTAWRQYRQEHSIDELLDAIDGTIQREAPVLEPRPLSTETLPPETGDKVNAKWERAHQLLNGIRDSGDHEAQDAILSNLAVFSRIITAETDERKTHPVSGATQTDILDKIPATFARADRVLAAKNVAPEKPGRNRDDHQRNKPGDPRRRGAAGGGSGD